MTAEERVSSLHQRMAVMRRKREQRKTRALGAGCVGLGACLTALIFSGSHTGGTAGTYTGAAMLFEDAGGYVLAAVPAFMLGVIITVLCIRYRKKREQENKPDSTHRKARETK